MHVSTYKESEIDEYKLVLRLKQEGLPDCPSLSFYGVDKCTYLFNASLQFFIYLGKIKRNQTSALDTRSQVVCSMVGQIPVYIGIMANFFVTRLVHGCIFFILFKLI